MNRALGIGIAILALGGGWLFLALSPPPDAAPVSAPVVYEDAPANSIPEKREPPSGWSVYENARYRFSLFHPETTSVTEYDEGAGAATFTFQDTAAVKGFQIFIVPYAEVQVSEARFRKDLSSGIRKELVDITIDGAAGAAFYSTDAFLGETREVWFIKNGYLYEITTPKHLESELRDMLMTWRFL